MWAYQAPLSDMRFVIDEVLGLPQAWARQAAHADLDADTAAQILTEAGKFASTLAPINGSGDLEACTWRGGEVRTPGGFRAAYQAFVQGGWPALACDPVYGGQGLPTVLNAALYEMLTAANHGWTMYSGLMHGAYECIRHFGSPALREQYLPGIVSGETLATMCLTEPQAGSDLGLVRCKGLQMADGSLRVSGAKIFISGGEHDLTDNIVHLVLCRLPDAPAGSRGLSLVLCPKRLPDGSRNGIYCDGIEKKMGIKGSATCSLRFEEAVGWLIGEAHRGLPAMFVMMNAARLHVGMQGLGHLEMATQNALRYAEERQQSRAPLPVAGASSNSGTAPIARHPAMRRTLWRLRAMLLAGRVLAYWTASLLDDAEQNSDAEARSQSLRLAELLTPVVKAFLTHQGYYGASEAQQVWGGYGYIHEFGIEQTVRDSRIAMIYEGTNEIQAIDLVQRKWLSGERMPLLLAVMAQEAADCYAHRQLRRFADALHAQMAEIGKAELALRAAASRSQDTLLSTADDALHGLGYALFCWAWARAARAALPSGSDGQHADRYRAAEFGVQAVLPQAQVHWRRIGDASSGLSVLPM